MSMNSAANTGTRSMEMLLSMSPFREALVFVPYTVIGSV